jgi:hypothetical protein
MSHNHVDSTLVLFQKNLLMAENDTKSKSRPTTKKKPIKKPISEARVQANRKNSQKSTGPKTPEGKAVAKWNALKHGMRAVGHVLIPGDDEEAYYARRKRWIEEQKPTTDVELYLLEDLVDASWMLDRCKSCNSTRVAKRVRGAIDRFDIQAAKRVRKLIDRLSKDAHPDIASRLLRCSVEGCDHVLGRLNWLLGSMSKRAYWYVSERDEVFRLFGHRPDEIFGDGFGVDLFDAYITGCWMHDHTVEENWAGLGVQRPDYMSEYEFREWMKDKLPTALRALVPKQHGPYGLITEEQSAELGLDGYYARVELEALLLREIERVESRREEVLERHLSNRAESPRRASCDASHAGQTIHRYEAMYRRAMFTILAKHALAKADPEGEPLSAPEPPPPPESPHTDMDVTNAKLEPTPPVGEAPVEALEFAPNEATTKVSAGPKVLPRMRFRRVAFHARTVMKRPVEVRFRELWELQGLSSAAEWKGEVSKMACLVTGKPVWSPYD